MALPVRSVLAAAALAAALIWSYWPTILDLIKDWRGDPNYSVGQLVPFAAVYLLWLQRATLRKLKPTACWWGIGLLALALAGRAFGVLFLYESAERYALVLAILGLVLLVAGRGVFWKLRWLLLFLFLMVPLPGKIHNMISGPLQGYATIGTVFVLEVAGITVEREGNVIVLNETTPIAVAEACSGLRMLTAFVIVAAVLAFIVGRPRWQKAVLVLSSVPIAIACNLARLFATAVLYLLVSSSTAELFFHDFAGVSMMPLAIVMMLGELWLLNKLVLPDVATGKAGRSPARSGTGFG